MAAPVISGTTPASPVLFAPGETKSIRVEAFDPDAGDPVSQTFTVADSTGSSSSVQVTLQVQDPLTYSADPAPTGWSIVQDAGDPALFHVTAPA